MQNFKMSVQIIKNIILGESVDYFRSIHAFRILVLLNAKGKEIADVLFLLIHSVAKINNIVYITNTSAKYLASMLQSQNFLSVNFVACLFCHSFYMIAYGDDDVEVVNSRRFVLLKSIMQNLHITFLVRFLLGYLLTPIVDNLMWTLPKYRELLFIR